MPESYIAVIAVVFTAFAVYVKDVFVVNFSIIKVPLAITN